MLITIATIFSVLLGIYTLIGFIFGLLFIFRGAHQLDEAAAEGGIGFKLLILPGTIAFWPLLTRKWLKARKSQ